MKEYTFLFTIFGSKKKWTVLAADQRQADSLFNDFISKNVQIDELRENGMKKPASASAFDKMKDIFGSNNFDDIFGDFFKKKK